MRRWSGAIADTGNPFFARLLLFLRFEDQKKVLLCHFQRLEALEACLEACPQVFWSKFHSLARLLASRSSFNCVSYYKLFVLLQFPSIWSLESEQVSWKATGSDKKSQDLSLKRPLPAFLLLCGLCGAEIISRLTPAVVKHISFARSPVWQCHNHQQNQK